MSRHLLLLLLPLPLTLACGDKGGDKDGGVDDTGEGGGGVTYEEGCITVDGGGGYAWIQDAITVAEEGSTITLCPAATHEESVEVDKGVTIVGPGEDQFVLSPPSNEHGFTITASGVSISGLTIDSTRSGIVLEGAANTELSEITVLAAGNWGVKSSDSTSVSLTGLTLLGNAYGGVQVDGGSLSMSESELSSNVGYGVFGTGGALITLTGNSISLTDFTDPDDPDDGHGVFVEDGAGVVSSGNTLDSNSFMNYYADGGDLDLSDDVLNGGFYGIIGANGDMSFSGLQITGAYWMGLYAVGDNLVSISDTTVSAEPELSGNQAYDEWGGDFGIGGSGVVALSPEVEVSGLTVSGYNNCGLLVAGDTDGGDATITDVTVDNTGRRGVLVENTTATMTNVSVSNLRDPDDVDETNCYYVNYTTGVYGFQANINWTGGELTGNEGWGVSNVYGSLNVDGVTFDSNECSGIVSYEGATTVTGSTFLGGAQSSRINSNFDSELVVRNSTFEDGNTGEPVEYFYDYSESSGYTITITYGEGYPSTQDISAVATSKATITDNVFVNGGVGIGLSGVDANISGNSWTDYSSYALYASSYSEGTTPSVTFADNTVAGFKGDAIGCSSISMEVEDVVIEGGSYLSYELTYLYDWLDGTTSESVYNQMDTSPAIYGSSCTMVLDGVEIEDVEAGAIQLYSYSAVGTYEFNDVSIKDVAQGSSTSTAAIYAYGYYYDNVLYFNEVSIDGVGSGSGLYIAPYTSSGGYSASYTVEATGLSISNVTAGSGIYLSNAAGSFTDLQVSDVSSYGVQAYRSSVEASGGSISSTGSYGFYLDHANAELDGVTVTGAGSTAVYWSNELDYDSDTFTVADGDCDDTNANRYPGAPELSDSIDNDCDGVADDGSSTSDSDGDGYTVAGGDCNDTDSATYPGASEIRWRVDRDCDGVAGSGIDQTLVLTGSTVSSNLAGGLYLSGGLPTVTDNAIEDNGGVGMTCASGDFAACSDNVVIGNLGGELSGCPTTCLAE